MWERPPGRDIFFQASRDQEVSPTADMKQAGHPECMYNIIYYISRKEFQKRVNFKKPLILSIGVGFRAKLFLFFI